MSSFFESIQKRRFIPTMPSKDALPISQTNQQVIGLRRRISSFSVKIRPRSAWDFRRSNSMPSISELTGGPLRRWWDLGWSWILSRKETFTRDLEVNEEGTKILGCQCHGHGHGHGGSWRHVFYKVRAEIRKLVRPSTLPTTQQFRYDSFSYKHNFDDGDKDDV